MVPLTNQGTHAEKKSHRGNYESEFQRSLIGNDVSIVEFREYLLGGRMSIHRELESSAPSWWLKSGEGMSF